MAPHMRDDAWVGVLLFGTIAMWSHLIPSVPEVAGRRPSSRATTQSETGEVAGSERRGNIQGEVGGRFRNYPGSSRIRGNAQDLARFAIAWSTCSLNFATLRFFSPSDRPSSAICSSIIAANFLAASFFDKTRERSDARFVTTFSDRFRAACAMVSSPTDRESVSA